MELFDRIFRNRESETADGGRIRIMALMLILSCVTVAVGLAASSGDDPCCGIVVDLMPYAAVLWVMASSLWENVRMRSIIWYFMAAGLVWIGWHLICLTGFFDATGSSAPVIFLSMNNIFLISIMIYGFLHRLKDIKSVMKTGSSWTIVCLIVDMVYVLTALAVSMFWQLGLHFVAFFIVVSMYAALCVRIVTDSVFVIWRKQETIIFESMKVASVTVAVDESRVDDIYKDLYERVLAYFEEEKPYLDGELTINELVKKLYSNKLYISRAISQFTGRNFCQFVNYYRVIHSMECFRNNPDHKIHELASMSGFNSIVSYNMAFRLFMGENPSDWCRKEKSRIIKKKKLVVESQK